MLDRRERISYFQNFAELKKEIVAEHLVKKREELLCQDCVCPNSILTEDVSEIFNFTK